MGGDGGVIAVKRKFIKGCKTEDKNEGRDVQDSLFMKATTCALSGQELNEPIACCKLGYLFNKEAIILSLLEKNLPVQFHHIIGLKVIKTLILTLNPEYNSSNSKNALGNNSNRIFKYICPITLLPFNGIHPFAVIWSTGYVISEKAIRELGTERLQDEYGPFTETDIIRLLPNEEELNQRRALLEAQLEVAQRKSSKKKREREREHDRENDNIPNTELTNETSESRSRNNHNLPNKKICELSSSSSSSSSLSTQQVLDHAQSKIQIQEEKSQVYQNLFHKDSEKKVTDRDLFIAVGGLRYTLS